MKKIILGIVFLSIFYGCSKDDGIVNTNNPPNQPRLISPNNNATLIQFNIEDPIYLEEPMVRSQTWIWNPPQVVTQRRAFEPVEEVAMDPGWVPHWPLGTKHPDMADRLGIEVEAVVGGSVTIYPEYRETLRQMREEFDSNRARE